MVNIEDFIKRLELLLDYYGLNASSFADKIGVQRSSLSHLLSGRNKPSLDFILKILEVYPEIDLYWILNGKGTFPSDEKTIKNPYPNDEKPQNVDEIPLFAADLFVTPNEQISTKKEHFESEPRTIVNTNTETIIEKIVVFYTNGTFKSFDPKL